jgi:hypothetical protein
MNDHKKDEPRADVDHLLRLHSLYSTADILFSVVGVFCVTVGFLFLLNIALDYWKTGLLHYPQYICYSILLIFSIWPIYAWKKKVERQYRNEKRRWDKRGSGKS